MTCSIRAAEVHPWLSVHTSWTFSKASNGQWVFAWKKEEDKLLPCQKRFHVNPAAAEAAMAFSRVSAGSSLQQRSEGHVPENPSGHDKATCSLIWGVSYWKGNMRHLRVRQKTEDMFTSSSHPGWLEYDIPLTNQGIQDSKDSLRYFTLYIWIFMSNCSFWLFSSKKKHYTMTCEHLFNCKNVILSISDLFGKKQPIWAFLVICYTRLIT